MKKIMLVVFIFTLSFIYGCTDKNIDGISDETGKINIVTTIFPPYDFARAVSGDEANLTMLIKAGVEIHSYDPSPADIIKIQNSDIFIYIGGESEDYVNKILNSMDISEKKVVRLMDYVNVVEEEIVESMEEYNSWHSHDDDDHDHDVEYDEHIWTSQQNAILMVNAIADAICEVDNENADFYRKNANDYIKEIEDVKNEIQEIVNTSKSDFLVFGDKFPFRYFADEYGLKYAAAFSGCSTETTCSVGTLAKLINIVRENEVSYIYTVELSNQDIARSINEQTNTETLMLHSAHNVTKDDFDTGATYVSIIKQNAKNLKKGLN